MSLKVTHHTFTHPVGSEILAATITRPTNTSHTQPTILIIHGAGPSGQHRYTFLAEKLASQGHTSLRFDHSGHGESTGQLNQSSLTKRLAEAKSFLPLLHSTAPLTVMGASMGGHIAGHLLPLANFQTFIAQVPAAYTQAAENLTFGATFTETIRQPEAWQDSLIWPILDKYTGKFLLISAEEDAIIPAAVLQSYLQHTANANPQRHLALAQAEHSLSGWLAKNPDSIPPYLSAIFEILPN